MQESCQDEIFQLWYSVLSVSTSLMELMGLLLKLVIQQNLMGLLIGGLLVSCVGLNIGTNEGIKLGFFNRKVVGTTLGAVIRFPLVAYVVSELGYLEGYNGGSVDGIFYSFLDQWMDLILENTKVLK